MRQFYIIILSLFISLYLFSCSNGEQEGIDTGIGYFQLSNLSLSCDEEILPLTRTADVSLRVQICQGEAVVKEYIWGDDLSDRIALPVGDYTLKVFTPDQSEAVNNEMGIPFYSVTSSFEVRDGDLTSLSLEVPQINIGVYVNVSEEFSASFHSSSVVVTSLSGRSVVLSDLSPSSPICYFDIPTDGKLQYIITAYNVDGEEMTLTKEITGIDKSKNYSIQLEIE